MNDSKQHKSSLLLPFIGILMLISLALGFFLGTQYQKSESSPFPSTSPAPTTEPITNSPVPEEPVYCTMDAKICPDGTAVGRTPPDCEFAECPSAEQE